MGTSPVSPTLAAEQPVRVRLLCAQGRVRRVEASWRRLPVEQLWLGQPVQAIEPALRRTLTICLQAHLGAARQAVRAALRLPDDDAAQASDAAIRLEAARDTLRRWLLDYPRAFGDESGGAWPAGALAGWKEIRDAATLAAYCGAHVFGMAAQDWLALDEAALEAWIEAGLTLPAQWLRQGLAAPLRGQAPPAAADLLAWAGAHAAPLLHGEAPMPAPPHALCDALPASRDLPSALLLHRLRRLALACAETATREHGGFKVHTSLLEKASGTAAVASFPRVRRKAGKGAAAASSHRDAALGDAECPHPNLLPQAGEGVKHIGLNPNRSNSENIGIGWARTARGMLLHLARIEEGRVTAYRILPPTVWNAAPDGLMAAALTGLAQSDAPRCAEQLLLLLDPCAPFQIALADEASPSSAQHAGNIDHA